MEIKGSVAVVTGGASGLGEATVRNYVEGGGRVGILDLQEERGQALASELGDSAIFCPANVTDEQSVQSAIDKTAEAFGAIHIAVNCAGVATPGKVRGGLSTQETPGAARDSASAPGEKARAAPRRAPPVSSANQDQNLYWYCVRMTSSVYPPMPLHISSSPLVMTFPVEGASVPLTSVTAGGRLSVTVTGREMLPLLLTVIVYESTPPLATCAALAALPEPLHTLRATVTSAQRTNSKLPPVMAAVLRITCPT